MLSVDGCFECALNVSMACKGKGSDSNAVNMQVNCG